MKETIIVTGSSGYIGGATCLQLRHKYNVIGIDLRRNPNIKVDSFVLGDFANILTDRYLLSYKPKAIIHCAGKSLVGQSFEFPSMYYKDNVTGTIKLLNNIVKANQTSKEKLDIKLIFSSSCSVYGSNHEHLIKEDSSLLPDSPYARSKLAVEYAIEDYARAYNIKYNILRYFNVCGAMDENHGQEAYSSHIFAMLFNCIATNTPFYVNGGDYKTVDGTCIRNYIHIKDVVSIHEKLISAADNEIINIGSYINMTNLHCVKTVENFYGKKINYIIKSRREGDAPALMADISKLDSLNLKTGIFLGTEAIMTDLYKWYNSKIYKNENS